MKQKIKNLILKVILQEPSPHKLALAVSLGISIAVSPFIGLHTLIGIASSLILGLNLPLTVSVIYIISNPWSMVPLLITDYVFGHWLFSKILKLDLSQYDPHFMNYINKQLEYYLGKYEFIGKLSLCEFILGGTILAIISGLIAYPITKNLIKKYENYNSK